LQSEAAGINSQTLRRTVGATVYIILNLRDAVNCLLIKKGIEQLLKFCYSDNAMQRRLIRIILITIFLSFSLLQFIPAAIESNEEEDFYVAAKAFEDGFYDLSLDTFRHFIRLYPDSRHLPEVEFFIGRCLFYQGKFLEALSQFQALLANPKAASLHDALNFWVGEVHFKGKDYVQAISFYKKVIQDSSNSDLLVVSYYSKGLSLFELNKFDEAIATFNELLQKQPKHALIQSVAFKAAESFYRAGQYVQAQTAFKKFIDDYPKSVRIPEAFYFLAEVAFYTADYANAIVLYRKTLSLIEKSPSVATNELKNYCHAGIGWSYLKDNKLEEAQREFFVAQENDAILLGRAAVKFTQNDFDSALELYDRLISRYPASRYLLDALLGKAETLYSRNSFEETVALYREIIDKFSNLKDFKDNETKIHYGLAWSLLKIGQFQEALKEFEKISKQSNDEIVKISALCQMGDTYQETKAFDKAIEIYNTLLKDYPDSLYSDYVQFQVAVSLYKQERLEAAILAFRSLLDNFPKTKLRAKVQYYLGLIYFQQANYQGAVDLLNSFVKESKDFNLKGDSLYLLASSYYNLGQYKQALVTFERIFKENVKKNEKLSQAAEYEIANCLYQLGKENDALSRFYAFLRKHPKSNTCGDILYWIGEYYMAKDNLEVARRYFRRLISEYPKHELCSSALYNIAVSYLESERFKAALKAFSEVRSSNNDELSFNAGLSMADIYISRGEIDSGYALYDELINDKRFSSFKPVVLIKKADTLRQQRRFTDALALYRKALELSSQNANEQLMFTIAEVEEEQGNLEAALEYYLKLAYLPSLTSDNGLSKRSLLRAARICEAQNKWEDAKKIYRKLSTSEVEEAKYALDRLKWIERHIDKKR
jgi:TolA-binding protein